MKLTKMILKLAAIGLIVASYNLFACQFSSDCEIGSKCIKSGYNMNGVCIGGMNPGNRGDSQPVYNAYNASDLVGKQCSYDMECGFGRRCIKEGYNLYGVCY